MSHFIIIQDASKPEINRSLNAIKTLFPKVMFNFEEKIKRARFVIEQVDRLMGNKFNRDFIVMGDYFFDFNPNSLHSKLYAERYSDYLGNLSVSVYYNSAENYAEIKREITRLEENYELTTKRKYSYMMNESASENYYDLKYSEFMEKIADLKVRLYLCPRKSTEDVLRSFDFKPYQVAYSYKSDALVLLDWFVTHPNFDISGAELGVDFSRVKLKREIKMKMKGFYRDDVDISRLTNLFWV